MNSYSQYQNGRVVGLNQDYERSAMFDDNNNNDTYKCEVIKGIHVQSPLNSAFFCKKNMDVLQGMIRHEVYKLSKGEYKIDRQSDTELVIVMRSMYFQYARNLPTNIHRQVMDLNKRVIEYAAPIIMSEIQQYIGYLDKVQTMPEVIDHPRNVSNKGTRTLPSVTTTF